MNKFEILISKYHSSYEEVGNDLHIDPEKIEGYITGTRRANAPIMHKFADYFGLSYPEVCEIFRNIRKEKNVIDVFNSMNFDQKKVTYFLVGAALEEGLKDKLLDIINERPNTMNENVKRDTNYKTYCSRNYAKGWNDCNRYWFELISNVIKEKEND